MNKIYFYLLYIPIGGFLLFSIGPYLKSRNFLKNRKIWDGWVEENPLLGNLNTDCKFCNSHEIFAQIIFQLPKTVKKKLFSFSESTEKYNYISFRCKKCQTEIGRKKD